jgi:hypothetical protein
VSQSKTAIGLLALQAMRVVEGDATPDSNDTAIIEAAYDQVYATLKTRHLVSWAPSGEVPDECVNPVVYLTAAQRLSLFTVPLDAQQYILSQAATAVGDLTEVLALDYAPVQVPSEPL